MEKEGYLSLWVGNIHSDDDLRKYVELKYTEDGEFEQSIFLNDFNIDIDEFDEDFIERVCYEDGVDTLSELISGCSYEDIVLPEILNEIEDRFKDKTNAAILLYNFDYDQNTSSVINAQYNFRFVCSVKYS